MKPLVNLYKLGRLSYVKALKVQQNLFDNLRRHVNSEHNNSFKCTETGIYNGRKVITNVESNQSAPYNKENSLILVEHEPVYTIGIRSKSYNNDYILELMSKLADHNLKADFVQANRGGLITFHGPGQLVAYPIIYLGDFNTTIRNRSVKAYVKLLEATIIDTLSSIGIKDAHTVQEYPGVWLEGGEKKIAFIGIACKRYITMHGISINCDCDLTWFDMIVSCGIEKKQITSISQELKSSHSFDSVGITSRDHISYSKRCSSVNSVDISSDMTPHPGKNSILTMDDISEAFCRSFSQQFDCNLEEGQLKLTNIL